MTAKNRLPANRKKSLARERLRRSFRPARVRILFVGESPPSSERFFYQADSGLYRAVRSTFIRAFPHLADADFLKLFSDLGCYLVDLCSEPVDRLNRQQRRQACVDGESRLTQILKQLQPQIVVTVVRSIAVNVGRAQAKAGWTGTHIELPYPGRWLRHRVVFEKKLVPVLRAIQKKL